MWRRAAVVGLLVLAIAAISLPLAFPVFRSPLTLLALLRADAPAHLPIPVDGIRPRQLTNQWGAPRSEGRRHQGIDIFARRGTPVRSTTKGIVINVGTSRRGGRVVWILGPNLTYHYYAHLDRHAPLREGQVVAAGALLGYVGTTGNAVGTPPHLHYGIYAWAGGPVNPYPLLRQ